nr:Crp/Fnr family transcriptional regulator [Rhodosalinus halophilus]
MTDRTFIHGGPCSGCSLGAGSACHLAALPRLRQRVLPADTVLFHQGDRPRQLGILRSGYMRIVRLNADGRRMGLDFAVPGDLLGGLPGHRIDYTVESATDAEVCLADGAGLEQGMRAAPALRRQVLRGLADQLLRVQEQIWLRGRLTSRERIIAFLVRATASMPADLRPDGSVIVEVVLPRRDWADLTDTAVETVSRTMTALAAQGELQNLGQGRYRIANLARLADLARLDTTEIPGHAA